MSLSIWNCLRQQFDQSRKARWCDRRKKVTLRRQVYPRLRWCYVKGSWIRGGAHRAARAHDKTNARLFSHVLEHSAGSQSLPSYWMSRELTLHWVHASVQATAKGGKHECIRHQCHYYLVYSYRPQSCMQIYPSTHKLRVHTHTTVAVIISCEADWPMPRTLVFALLFLAIHSYLIIWRGRDGWGAWDLP